MTLIELSLITSIVLEMGVDAAKKNLGRREAIINILKRLNLDSKPLADDFEAIYAYTLVEYGVFKPEPILNFFRHKIIIKAFRRALYENNLSILEKEAEDILDWNKETAQLGEIDYDPRLEFASFTAIFNQIVDNLRSPAEVKRDQKLDEVYSNTEELLLRLEKLTNLEAVRSELARLLPINQSASIASDIIQTIPPKKTIRWLHLSDFHVGKDGYGQRQLFKYILNHIEERVKAGVIPDIVFITGDIANKGQEKEYQEFFDNFYVPLWECLPLGSRDHIFIIPGNHDVDRNQARLAQTNDALLRVPEFLDPTEQGQFERQVIFPRFKSFVQYDPTNIKDHWLNSWKGTLQTTLEFNGTKIGILGVNTAWLSYGDNDRHNLSVGKSLLEDGLDALRDCEVKIVIGHHPIDWFLDSELQPVSALFGKHAALYLHGHMHKAKSRYEEGGGYPFLALQSGASFQARENEAWVNRFLWCELDLANRELGIEPLQWSNDHQSWVTDGTAFPSRYQQGDRWIIPLPSPVSKQTFKKVVPFQESSKLEIPDGWNLVNTQDLKNRHKELSNEQAISFFDGRAPNWREALAPQIPRREIVSKLVDDLETTRQEGGLCVTLLTGAAGEGKTTAILQTVCDLVYKDIDWQILFRYDPVAPLPAEFLSKLPDTGTWLIVSDDAEVIARRVYDSIRALKENGRKNIQFLLCCRDTDWKAVDGENFSWNEYAKYITESLRGLTKTDAEKVVRAWSMYGKDGLKTLDGMQYDDAANQLLLAAKSEETNNADGSFFGAILQVRWGAGLKNHIDSLLRKLEKQSISNGKTLLDAFAYIAAMHAENIQLLSREVLAGMLGVTIGELKKKVLGPLGEEAAIATTGRFVFTRHNAIARIATYTLSEKYYYDLEDIYLELARTALGLKDSGTYIPNFGEWAYLSSHFFDKGNQILGIRLAEMTLLIDPNNHHYIVKLSQLYRKANQPDKSVNLFRSKPEVESKDRHYYYEWSTAEGSTGCHALSVCLAALSLADETVLRPPSNDDAKLSLSGLSIAFLELYNQFNSPIFNNACGAVAQLGLTLRLDNKGTTLMQNSLNHAKGSGFQDVPSHEALEFLNQGILEAWNQRENKLPEWIMPSNN